VHVTTAEREMTRPASKHCSLRSKPTTTASGRGWRPPPPTSRRSSPRSPLWRSGRQPVPPARMTSQWS